MCCVSCPLLYRFMKVAARRLLRTGRPILSKRAAAPRA